MKIFNIQQHCDSFFGVNGGVTIIFLELCHILHYSFIFPEFRGMKIN